MEIKAINIIPLFKWDVPDEWSKKLGIQGLGFKVTGYNNRGGKLEHPYDLSSLVSRHHHKPTIILNKPINIPLDVNNKALYLNDYPIKIEIELYGSVEPFEFDATFIYDEV